MGDVLSSIMSELPPFIAHIKYKPKDLISTVNWLH